MPVSFGVVVRAWDGAPTPKKKWSRTCRLVGKRLGAGAELERIAARAVGKLAAGCAAACKAYDISWKNRPPANANAKAARSMFSGISCRRTQGKLMAAGGATRLRAAAPSAMQASGAARVLQAGLHAAEHSRPAHPLLGSLAVCLNRAERRW